MALKLFTTLKNNWKKSIFAGCAFAYGINYAKQEHESNNLMTDYCKRALKYGEQPISPTTPLRKIIVILNPAADKRKAKKYFEKYCAPILHLSGALVDIKVTKGEGDARKIVESLKEKVDAIVIAGGDGTVSEVVTGLLRGFNHDCFLAKRIPIGILPLGKNNHIVKSLYDNEGKNDDFIEKVKFLATASMTIVKETKSAEKNVLCVQVLEDESKEKNRFYALNNIEWGNLKSGQIRQDKYWYFGALKSYVTYVFNGFSIQPLNLNLTYTNACTGCKQCCATRQDIKIEPKKQWYQIFTPVNENKSINYKMIENDQCGVIKKESISTMDLVISAVPPPQMTIIKGLETYDYQTYVKQGWNYEETNLINASDKIHAQYVDIIPEENTEETEEKSNRFLYIDNEEFEVKPLRITLLQNTIQLYNP